MLSVFSSPSRYTQGKNATAQLGAEMGRIGLEGPALIVASRSVIPLLLRDGTAARLALQHHSVTPALERLVEANTLLSGLGFESSGLAAAHAVHNGLTAAAGTHRFFHGEKVAFGTLVQLVLEVQPQGLIDEVLGFAMQVGLPVCLGQIGLEDADASVLRQIAARATANGETIHNEPFAVDSDMVVDAIRAADAIGRQFRARA